MSAPRTATAGANGGHAATARVQRRLSADLIDAAVRAGEGLWRLVAAASRSRLAAPVGVAVLVAGVLFDQRHGTRVGDVDFRSFYGAANDVRAGHDPYGEAISFIHGYSPSMPVDQFGTKAYVYAPFFAFLLTPLTLLPASGALAVWDVLNLAFLVTAVYAAFRVAGIRVEWRVLLLIAAAASITQPIHKEWQLGQTDVFAMCVVWCAFWAVQSGRPRLGGMLFGIVCPLKPALSVLLLFLAWKREFRTAVVGAAVSVIVFVAPFAALPRQAWSDEWTIWNFWSHQFLTRATNVSPDGVLLRLFTTNPVVRPLRDAPAAATILWIAVVAVVGVLCATLISTKPLRRDLATLLEICLLVEAIMIVSPLTEWPYLVHLVVPLAAVVLWLRARGLDKSTALVAASLAAVWALLVGVGGTVESHIENRFFTRSVIADVYVLAAPIYLYTLLAAFGIVMYLVATEREVRLPQAIPSAVRGLPGALGALARDAGTAAVGAVRRGGGAATAASTTARPVSTVDR